MSLGTPIQDTTFYDKYSRYDHATQKHETFTDACDRTVDFMKDIFKSKLPLPVFSTLRSAMYDTDAFCGMRLFQNAGDSAMRDPESIYNCSYLPVTDINSFCETMNLLGLGVGVGYSVEQTYVARLPQLTKLSRGLPAKQIVVEDSLYGWVDSLRELLTSLFEGQRVAIDYSEIRPKGSPLYVRGGFASGPEPLMKCFERIQEIFGKRSRAGFLRTIDAHDVQCAIASAIVSGGVRRAAMIALFDSWDNLMLGSKSGNWYETNLDRRFANNSIVILDKWNQSQFDGFFKTMQESNSGEPGIFSRVAANATRPVRRKAGFFGTNPCGEIALNPWQFCNLSIANVRSTDGVIELKEKVRLATIWGTMQAAYLTTVKSTSRFRPQWYINQEEERLLGVDLNGLRDNPMLNEMFDRNDKSLLSELRKLAVETNVEFAGLLGIAPAAAVTCDKPAGNSASLFNTASGIGSRYAPYYTRRMRFSSTSRVAKLLAVNGLPFEPEVGQSLETADTLVFEFPVKSPDGAVYGSDNSAIDQLNFWKWCKTGWTEHNPSTTIYFSGKELDEISRWAHDNQSILSGVSFLPRDNSVYKLAPYEVISKETYEERTALFPDIDWSAIDHIDGDISTSAQEFACVGGACDIV